MSRDCRSRSYCVSTENGWKTVLLRNVNCIKPNRSQLKQLIPIEHTTKMFFFFIKCNTARQKRNEKSKLKYWRRLPAGAGFLTLTISLFHAGVWVATCLRSATKYREGGYGWEVTLWWKWAVSRPEGIVIFLVTSCYCFCSKAPNIINVYDPRKEGRKDWKKEGKKEGAIDRSTKRVNSRSLT